MSTTAEAPSEICDELPAVIDPPCAKAGRRPASVSTVVSGRMPSSFVTTTGSPLRCGISTGTISASNTPSACAAAARWCERAATASCASRLISNRSLCRSVDAPMLSRS